MSILYGFNLPFLAAPIKNTISAKELNNEQYYELFNRIVNAALSRFKWSGLPDSCRPDILEQTLLFYGNALFFDDTDIGFVHTPCELPGPFNIYYESVERYAYSFEYHKRYTIDDSVLIKASSTQSPDVLSILNYTKKIANTMRAIDVHVETLKRPFMIKCNEKERLSAKKMIEKIMDNEVAVFGEKMGDLSSFNVLPIAERSFLQDMWATLKNYFSEVYASLGIRNTYTGKKERLVTSEAEGSANAVRHVLEDELKNRKEAAERINKMFGLNVEVESNEVEVFTPELSMYEHGGFGDVPID